MYSGSLERAGTPRKRTLSRGMSEEESLRHIIKDAEESTKRLTRSDSRQGSFRREDRTESQSEADLTALPEMVDLQASYEESLQEVRGLVLQRETLLFQVDCLQDALEGAEETLAEKHRENHDLCMEVEREKEARRRLENMVNSLMQEVERLKEQEKNTIPAVPVYTLVKAHEEELRDTLHGQEPQTASNEDASLTKGPGSPEAPVETSTVGGILSSFFKKGKAEQLPERNAGPIWLQGAPEGTSVDQEEDGLYSHPENKASEGEKLTRIQKMADKTFDPSDLPLQGDVLSSQFLQAVQEDNDESSAYEDAASELPEQEASTPDGSPAGEFPEEEVDGAEQRHMDGCEPGSPKSESCSLS